MSFGAKSKTRRQPWEAALNSNVVALVPEKG